MGIADLLVAGWMVTLIQFWDSELREYGTGIDRWTVIEVGWYAVTMLFGVAIGIYSGVRALTIVLAWSLLRLRGSRAGSWRRACTASIAGANPGTFVMFVVPIAVLPFAVVVAPISGDLSSFLYLLAGTGSMTWMVVATVCYTVVATCRVARANLPGSEARLAND